MSPVRESASSTWLPLQPGRGAAGAVPNGDFAANVSEWSQGSFPSGTAWALQATYGSLGSGNDNFDNPLQVALDAAGNLYIADQNNNRVIKRNSSGAYVAQITGLTSVTGVTVDASGNIYVAYGATLLRKYDAALALQWTSAAFAAAPGFIATDGTHVYIANPVVNVIHKRLCSTGAHVADLGSSGSGNGQFNDPWGVAIAGGNLFVTDQANLRVQEVTTTGTYVRQWAVPAGGTGIAVDASGNILTTHFSEHVVRRYTNVGVLIDSFVQNNAAGIAVGSGDVVWVTNNVNDNLTKWDEAATSAAFSWNNAVAVGAALGALAVTVTNGDAGDTAQVLSGKYFQINERESIDVAATVRTSNANLTPRLQLLFYDSATPTPSLIATQTEADWTPVANTNYRRSFAARVPSNATQYRIGFVASVDASPTTATVYADDFTTGQPTLIVSDAAGDTSGLKIEVQIPGKWI